MYENFSAIRVEGPDEAGILTVQLVGPSLHAVNAQAHAELTDVWKAIASDEQTRVVIIRGEGEDAFSSGGSFDLVESMVDDWGVRSRVMREARELVRNIIDCPQPIVSAINGPAAGAGLVAAVLADISVAGANAKIVDGHVRLGVAAGDHAAVVWPMMMSMAKAKYHLLTNEVLTGTEAERLGLVSVCVDDSDVQETARSIAQKLARGSSAAIKSTKHALNNWYRQSFPIFEASLGYEFFDFGGPDVIEGVQAHREKRSPRFS